jgi:hypothetical protein
VLADIVLITALSEAEVNRSGDRVYSGQLASVGTGFSLLTVDTPDDPPESGWITQIIVEKITGSGTAFSAKIEDVPIAGQDIEVDDGAGGDTPFPENLAGLHLWYTGLTGGIPVQVKVNTGADTTVKVTLVIEVP